MEIENGIRKKLYWITYNSFKSSDPNIECINFKGDSFKNEYFVDTMKLKYSINTYINIKYLERAYLSLFIFLVKTETRESGIIRGGIKRGFRFPLVTLYTPSDIRCPITILLFADSQLEFLLLYTGTK